MNARESELSTVLVTGGAGFIGSALCRYLVEQTGLRVVCLDKLTYAASLECLSSIARNPRFAFQRDDIADEAFVTQLLAKYQPDAIVNLAAETHVDRSI